MNIYYFNFAKIQSQSLLPCCSNNESGYLNGPALEKIITYFLSCILNKSLTIETNSGSLTSLYMRSHLV